MFRPSAALRRTCLASSLSSFLVMLRSRAVGGLCLLSLLPEASGCSWRLLQAGVMRGFRKWSDRRTAWPG
eukprot:48144-Prymnesium_polylepis.1